jgi:dihydroflavonol-4-reductase
MATETPERPVLIITGCGGLIGTQLIAELARDHRVVGIDVTPPPKPDSRYSYLQCDLTSDADVARTFGELRRTHGGRIASVIHLAAYYDFSGEPSPMYRKLTVEGTQRLIRELKKLEKVEQLVFTSTLLVMEPAKDEGEVITESSPLEDEPWDYPRSKIAAEELIRREHGDIPAVILRIAGVYDEAGHSIPIAQHIARIREKKIESYFFPGNPAHGTPYVHMADLVACVRLVVAGRHALGPHEVFLVAEPDIVSHAELQDIIGDLIHGKEWPTIRIPKLAAKAGAWVREKLAGDEKPFIKPWMVDAADAHYPIAARRAREKLGWKPQHRLRDTLPAMIRFLRQEPTKFHELNKLPLPDDLKERKADGKADAEATE